VTERTHSRRRFLQSTPLCLAAGSLARGAPKEPIDRQRLVRRHNPTLTEFNPRAPLSVGNGEFAFTADVTGLQTFPEAYEGGIPLCTQSQWGWQSLPIPKGLGAAELRLEMYDTYGRAVGYATRSEGQKEVFDWLRENPHRLHLGRIGLRLNRADLSDTRQTLDLWTGVLTSSFRVKEQRVTVKTCCHPVWDLLAVEIESREPLTVLFDFPYGSPQMSAADWKSTGAHRTVVVSRLPHELNLWRQLNNDRYFVSVMSQGMDEMEQAGPHLFHLRGWGRFGFMCLFSPVPRRLNRGSPADAFLASERHWGIFWGSGAAVELDGSKDPRAKELERRIVLSQYLTAIQCAGSRPPQETGLTCNSWYGKFHLEMHWWHAAHFALWGRAALLRKSMSWYRLILPTARAKARSQGYDGVRWPKMVGPEGRDSPSPVGPLLIWQQPHPICLAELCFQSTPRRETLDQYAQVVFESAHFMASYAHWDAARRRYVLGPPVIPAQENHPARETWNPTYELVYWAHGLKLAQLWRKRLGLHPEPAWEHVRRNLSPLPVGDGVYLAHENCPQTFTERNRDHPSMLAALGVLPGEGVDRETMRRTLKKVMREWRWPDTWGWDFPMTAMTAARLGETQIAVDALLMESPKNLYLPNGHNYQRPDLPLYLPGNGGLLAAVALMAGGWHGGPKSPAPGFPRDTWTVRTEGLTPLL
jgi:hypothetical protein